MSTTVDIYCLSTIIYRNVATAYSRAIMSAECRSMNTIKQEIDAMSAIAAALEPLSEEERGRVLEWVLSRYAPTTSRRFTAAVKPGGAEPGGAIAEAGFADLASFFDAA